MAIFVPGIDFSNIRCFRGACFYTDTQLLAPSWAAPKLQRAAPINRPVCPFHNNA